jgi:hypothetical protein
MITCKSISWWIWPVVVAGLLLIGSCGDNGPTIPNPTDVKDYSEGGGDDIGQEDLGALAVAYQSLRDAGGGVRVADAEGFSLIAVFDRWTATPLNAFAVFEGSEEVPSLQYIPGVRLFEGLEFPITISVFCEGYVTETIVDTNANVLVLGLEPLPTVPGGKRTFNVYYSPGDIGGENETVLWTVLASTTRIGGKWAQIWSGPVSDFAQEWPTILECDANKPVGTVAFLYELVVKPVLGTISCDPTFEDYEAVGYTYQDFGMMKYGLEFPWLVEFTEATPNSYFDANFSIDPTIWDGGTPGEHTPYLRVTPGGCVSSTWEFIPYGPQVASVPEDANGTYSVEAYDPPITVDRDIICGEIGYSDGRSEVQFADWNPAGTSLPDLTFGIPPVCDEILASDGCERLNASWTNEPVEGILTLELTARTKTLFWRIYLGNDAEGLPEDGLHTNAAMLPYLTAPDAMGALARVACAGISIDGFDRATVWENAASFASSQDEAVSAGPPLPEP